MEYFYNIQIIVIIVLKFIILVLFFYFTVKCIEYYTNLGNIGMI